MTAWETPSVDRVVDTVGFFVLFILMDLDVFRFFL